MESKVSAHCTVEAIVYRADGRVENLGVICEGDTKPVEKKSLIKMLKGMFKHG